MASLAPHPSIVFSFLGLKLYNRTPHNGLVIYCGTIVTDDGKEKKVSIDFEPFKPINTSLYLCDNKVSRVELGEEIIEEEEEEQEEEESMSNSHLFPTCLAVSR